MLAFPLLAPALGLNQYAFGLWAGASIHEVAQVVGASFQNGPTAGEIGIIAKLVRVAMLAPMIIALGVITRNGANGADSARPPMPWFVFAFVGVVILNSLVSIPDEVRTGLGFATTLLLAVGLAAMGLQADISSIRSRAFGH